METNGRIVQVMFNGITTNFHIRDSQDHIQKHWIRGTFYEASGRAGNGLIGQFNLMGDVLHPEPGPGYAIDCGASIGNHTLFLANVINMNVLAIEPFGPSYGHLVKNLEVNQSAAIHVRPIKCALGTMDTTMRMAPYGDQEMHPNVGMVQWSRDGDEVKVRPLDSVVKDWDPPRVDLIKIDVEHMETQVLYGAARTIQKFRPYISVEAETLDELADIEQILLPQNYSRLEHSFNHTPTYLFYPNERSY